MTKWILLLQGINVGGQKRMPMPELQSLLSDLGLQSVRTYIQSGNAVFASHEADRAVLAEMIGIAIGDKFGFTTPVFLRSAAEMARVAGENPFLTARSEDPAFLAAHCCSCAEVCIESMGPQTTENHKRRTMCVRQIRTSLLC